MIAQGYFWNEFLRIIMIFTAAALAFYAEVHLVIRNTVSTVNYFDLVRASLLTSGCSSWRFTT